MAAAEVAESSEGERNTLVVQVVPVAVVLEIMAHRLELPERQILAAAGAVVVRILQETAERVVLA
jgi:predicted short-subunit dehydrogenase-like oxidoreductase (DUF2520 family)